MDSREAKENEMNERTTIKCWDNPADALNDANERSWKAIWKGTGKYNSNIYAIGDREDLADVGFREISMRELIADATRAENEQIPHDRDHGRPGNPVAWCKRCELDAALKAV